MVSIPASIFSLQCCAKSRASRRTNCPERIGVNKSTVTRTLAQLEQSGFIRRAVNQQDKRTTSVHPTQKAYTVFPQIMNLVSRWDAAVTAQFEESEKRALQILLRRLAEAAKVFGRELEISDDNEDERA